MVTHFHGSLPFASCRCGQTTFFGNDISPDGKLAIVSCPRNFIAGCMPSQATDTNVWSKTGDNKLAFAVIGAITVGFPNEHLAGDVHAEKVFAIG